jgi:hypothetical protein
MNQIEKLSRMRRTILWTVFAGTGVAAVLLLFPIVVRSARYLWWPAGRNSLPIYYWAFAIWFLTLLVFVVLYLLYKRKLRRDPALRIAIDDERVRTDWLKAYRFAFLTTVMIAVLSKAAETVLAPALMRGSFPLPDKTWFLLTGAVLSLVGSFLRYNHETADE